METNSDESASFQVDTVMTDFGGMTLPAIAVAWLDKHAPNRNTSRLMSDGERAAINKMLSAATKFLGAFCDGAGEGSYIEQGAAHGNS